MLMIDAIISLINPSYTFPTQCLTWRGKNDKKWRISTFSSGVLHSVAYIFDPKLLETLEDHDIF